MHHTVSACDCALKILGGKMKCNVRAAYRTDVVCVCASLSLQ
jgi:hypothetical protein